LEIANTFNTQLFQKVREGRRKRRRERGKERRREKEREKKWGHGLDDEVRKR
jgi:hypothetical protein